MKYLMTATWVLAFCSCASLVQAQSLKGSPASIDKQYRAAVSYGYAFVSNARSVTDYVNARRLVRVNPDRYMELHDVSYPYAVPQTQQFLGRLSQQYYNACGEKLTVTSLLRPRDRQPANSVARSVHPAGMAVDLRVPRTGKCRTWLENTLLTLEKQHVVDVTRERRPPHYHVAVFGRDRGESQGGGTGLAMNSGGVQEYRVRKGDTLSRIASQNGVSVAQLRAANNLRGSLINIGQKLQIPGASGGGVLASGETTTHRVNRGDTLWRIAHQYGISVEKLRRTNSKSSDFLQVGQVLTISKG